MVMTRHSRVCDGRHALVMAGGRTNNSRPVRATRKGRRRTNALARADEVIE
jgi:hypothetical protein